jgi:hypothetical protein
MPLYKVLFELPTTSWHGYPVESLWAESGDGEELTIASIPFFVTGISRGDVVLGKLIENGIFQFSSVLKKSGHCTYRVIPVSTPESITTSIASLESMGVGIEKGEFPASLYALDVPPHVSVHRVYEELERLERGGLWHFEEGDCQLRGS